MHNTTIQGFQLSPQQQQLWSLAHHDRRQPYNAQSAVLLEGPLDPARLRAALHNVVERHEILRTTFRLLPGMPMPLQVIDEARIAWEDDHDLSDLDPQAQVEAFDRLFDQGYWLPIDVEQGPVLHAALVRLAHDRQVLLVRLPAMCADRRTLTNLTAQLCAAYQGLDQDDLDEPIQYVMVSDWLNELLESEQAEPGKKYWRQKASAAAPAGQLPFECGAGQVEKSVPVRPVFSPDLAGALEALARAHATTIDVVLLACWQVLLWRLTGSADMVVGTAFDGRSDEELAGTLGLFTKYLPVCSRPASDMRFADLLRQIAQDREDAAAWQECFTWSDFAGAQPAGAEPPFFAFCFDFERQDERYAAHSLVFSSYRQRVAGERFQVKLTCARTASGVEALFDYDPQLFAPADVERLARQFAMLAAAAARDLSSPISALEILDAAERHQLLAVFNSPSAHPPTERCLPELFEEQVARTPTHPALVLGEQELTYAELNARVNALALHLQRLGVGPEVFVGLYLERSVEMIIGLLAVLKAGGVYAPLDPESPRERLELILGQIHAPVILTWQRLASGLPPSAARVVCLDTEELPSDERVENVASGIVPQNLAYVIFTSGSTGIPKGVLVSHAALASHCLAARTFYAYVPGERVLQFAVFHFDASLEQLLTPLLSGATVVLRGNEVWDAARFAAEIVDQRLSMINLPTAYWHQLTAEWATTSAPPSDHRLQLVIVGGEAMLPEYVRTWERMFGRNIRLLNAYGPTEATITATICPVNELTGDNTLEQEVPIGRPFGDRTAYILDPYRNLAPIGAVGELYLGGVSLARGYLGQPALTAERFIPNPFGMQNAECRMQNADDPSEFCILNSAFGARLYRTGDLARYLPDGQIVFAGRVDHQIKLRGFRIELGEIEAALAQHLAVREAVVLAHENTPGGMGLVAYVVLRTGATTQGAGGPTHDPQPLTPDLRVFLQEKLPNYMVPGDIVFMESFPITTSGKIDRRALPNPATLKSESRQTYVAPRTPVEEALAEIWADVFNRDKVGVFDNFFDLGGHSLIATQLVARVRAVFQAEVSLRSLLSLPTVAGLARTVEQALRDSRGLTAPPLMPAARDGVRLLLSFAQLRLWFLQQFEPDSPAYNLPGLIRIRGALDAAALTRSLTEIIRRHEALRTTFTIVDGEPVQVLVSPTPHTMPEEDLRHLPADEREAVLARMAEAEACRPFDLERDPLLRTVLLQLDEAEYALLFTMHHIVADEWSVNLLVQELTALYEAFAVGRAVPLPELPLQYADYALWQREWLQGEALEAQLAYWKTQLAGAPALLALPTDRPRLATQTFNGASRSFSLPASLSDALGDLSRREETTLFMTLLAAFQAQLARFSGQDDIVVGSPIAGRTHAEIEGLIGCFLNTLALRTDLSGRPTFKELLARVREVTLAAYAHQDVPFEKLVEEIQPARDLSHAPLFQVMFTLQHRPVSRFALRDLDLSLSGVENHTTKFDLTLIMTEDDALSGTLEYNTDLFDEATIERLIEHFERLLAGFVADPEQPIEQVSLLSEAERQLLLVDWNATSTPLPPLCLHELFEAQAARTPNALAVMFDRGQGPGDRGQGTGGHPPASPRLRGDRGGPGFRDSQSSVLSPQSLTYCELNARANRLAHALQARGVGPDTLVAVMMERSMELLVALLGVLKAGGAYIPIDPGYPAERVRFMLADSHPAVVLIDDHAGLADRLAADAAVFPTPQICTPHDPELATYSDSNLASAVTPDHLAYVIYTSGSTGRPKGAMILHGGLSNYLIWAVSAYAVAAGAGALVHSSIAFDLTVTSLFTPLLAGRAVHLAPEERGGPPVLEAPSGEEPYSLVKLTPAHLEVLRSQIMPAAAARHSRVLVVGGEQLRAESVRFWRKHAPQTALINEYGPTETVVGCCVYMVQPDDPQDGPVPIGRPIANTQLYILDRYFQPAPIGMPGELYIGGAGLARGYLNRADLTAERFVPNPFLKIEDRRLKIEDSALAAHASLSSIFYPLSSESDRLYKTGDLARYRADGVIEFLGRVDDQVKVRGFRIEPSEIEATLLQHPAVGTAAVVAREDAPGEQRLVAYVVPTRGQGTGNRGQEGTVSETASLSPVTCHLSPGELRAFLKERLPDYMVPAAFVMLTELPITPNGKIDRRALPAPDAARPELDMHFVAPRTSVEAELARIWAEVLGIVEIGVYDNFFELGGHSLKAVQVLSRVSDAFQVDMSLQSLFRAPIIADFALAIEQTATRPAALPAIKPLARQPRRARQDLNLAGAAETDGVSVS